MTDDAELDYAALAQNALRRVVHDVLSITAELGVPPGEHHFYIEFQTQAPGVVLADRLRAQYPDRMTIVLQHQFEDLVVEEDAFFVTLRFKGIPDRLEIPFAALTQFADPSVNFALQFPDAGIDMESETPAPEPEHPDHQDANVATLGVAAKSPGADRSGADDPDGDGDGDGAPSGGADVVRLDRFRKK